jgi:membrane protease YdiL (CAAX protease family)
LKVRNMVIRIGTVLLFSILIWRLFLYLNGVFSGDDDNSTIHFFTGLSITILCFILVNTALRIDKISWKQIGISSLRTNIISFFTGTILWAIPAIIGLVICLLIGSSEITVITNLNQLILSILILYITVLLIEAFPEELISRGYIYSYLNALFPHWITLIVQTLIFSLFAYFVGAIYSLEQLLFIPGYGFMLGYFRAKSGNVWTSIGFHVAIMTASQILNPIHSHFDVSGVFAIRFFAFNLLPYILLCLVGFSGGSMRTGQSRICLPCPYREIAL